jgi:hypothetical protein
MSKMGLHDPFGHLKHKLWPEEGSGVKLVVWLLTSKSLESTIFTCVQVACDMLLESSWWGLQLWFIPRLHTKLWGAKVVRVPKLVISGNPGTKNHLDEGLVKRCKVYYMGGRWWLPLSLGRGESCESEFARGSS